MIRLLALVVFLLVAVPAYAIGPCTFYFDANWTGTHSGTASQPWNAFGSTEKSAINTALGSGDVYLCFAARLAGSDANSILDIELDLSFRTLNSNRLIFDGISYYNTSEVTPSWASAGHPLIEGRFPICLKGVYGCATINNVTSQNSPSDNVQGSLISYVSIIGFNIETSTSDKAITWCGSEAVIWGNDMSQNGGDGQPIFQIVPTADSVREGSHVPCPPMQNGEVAYNVAHEGYAEAMYLGAGGCTSNDPNAASPNCGGFPAHHGFRFHHNEIYQPAIHGTAQGDGFDIKGGWYDLEIDHNNIHDLPQSEGIRCIVMQGKRAADPPQNISIHDNTCKNIYSEDADIAVVNSWGTPDGVDILNNKIIGGSHGEGIRVYNNTGSVRILNNHISGKPDVAIDIVDTDSATIKNNVFYGNNSNGAQVSLAGSVTCTNNAHSGTLSGTCTSSVSGMTTGDFVSYATNDFHVASGSSKQSNAGADLTSLSITALNTDFDGVARPVAAWDAGVYELASCSPHHLSFTSQPSSAALGSPIGTVSVGVYDASNNLCTDATNAVTVSKNGSATWGTLSWSSSDVKTPSSGIATWTDLYVITTPGSGSIDVTASGLTGATSSSFTISAAGTGGGIGARLRINIR